MPAIDGRTGEFRAGLTKCVGKLYAVKSSTGLRQILCVYATVDAGELSLMCATPYSRTSFDQQARGTNTVCCERPLFFDV